MRVRRSFLTMVAFGVGALALSASGAGAQTVTSARIEILVASSFPYEYVVYPATETGGLGPSVARSDQFVSGGWAVDVQPGCYAVTITQTGGPTAGWIDPISNQPAFCLDAGETEVFDTGDTAPFSSGRSIMNGEVVDPDGNRIGGAVIDFFLPPDGLSFNEVRMLDHRVTDHRRLYETSRVSSDANWVYTRPGPLCRIQTLIAPDGFTWSGGRRYLNRSGCMSEYVTIVAYPDSVVSPEYGWIEVQIPDGLGPIGMTATIGLEKSNPLPDRLVWFRALGTPPYPFKGRYSVPPGCHNTEFALGGPGQDGRGLIFTASGRAIHNVRSCVGPGETVSVAPAGRTRAVSYDLSHPFLTGGFVTTDGAPVPNVQADLFYPQEDLSDEDLRVVDHSAADYRGPFYRSTTSDEDGRYTIPIYGTCFVATFIAPDGFSFDTGRYHQLTKCQGEDVVPVTLHPKVDRVEFSGRVMTSTGTGVEGILVDVFSPIDGVGDDVLRTADHSGADYRGQYVQTYSTDADGRFGFQAEARCWVLTYIADGKATFSTGRYLRQTICAGDSPVVRLTNTGVQKSAVVKGVVSGGAEMTTTNAVGTLTPIGG